MPYCVKNYRSCPSGYAVTHRIFLRICWVLGSMVNGNIRRYLSNLSSIALRFRSYNLDIINALWCGRSKYKYRMSLLTFQHGVRQISRLRPAYFSYSRNWSNRAVNKACTVGIKIGKSELLARGRFCRGILVSVTLSEFHNLKFFLSGWYSKSTK